MTSHDSKTLVERAADDREACRSQLAENRRAARAVVEGRSESELLRRPEPDAWSVAECLLHLNQAGSIYLGAIDRAIARGRERGSLARTPSRHPWLSRWFAASFEPPPKRRLKAPRKIRPDPPTVPVASIVQDFERLGTELGARLDASDGLDLGRVRVVSPLLPLLRLSLGMTFAMLAAHERRHLDQARRVLTALGAPTTGPRP